MTDPMAYTEHQRIRNLTAFSVAGGAKRFGGNQHMAAYKFPDGSVLQIGRGWAKSSNTNGCWVCHGTIATNASRFMGARRNG